jgi:hypothetical protein
MVQHAGTGGNAACADAGPQQGGDGATVGPARPALTWDEYHALCHRDALGCSPAEADDRRRRQRVAHLLAELRRCWPLGRPDVAKMLARDVRRAIDPDELAEDLGPLLDALAEEGPA